MLQQFLNHIGEASLCDETERILVAVSGGVDSMVLLRLFLEGKFAVGVAHCNFGLRGADSDADEAFVRTYCKENKVPFFSRRFAPAEEAARNGISIQMAARDLRYAWFEALAQQERYDKVATAHHADDNVETVIMNFVKGASPEGLAGIPKGHGKVIRPLLFARRDAIRNYAVTHELPWREDLSNRENYYQRNFIRNKVIPLLHEINPSLEASVNMAAERSGMVARVVDLFARSWADNHVKETSSGRHVPIKELLATGAGPFLLWWLIRDSGFRYPQCREALAPHQPGSFFESATHRLVIDRDEMIVCLRAEPGDEGIRILAPSGHISGPHGALDFRQERYDGQSFHDVPTTAHLDLDKLRFPLTWRRWREGDFLRPLGMEGKKKVSDLLIDLKVPLPQKQAVTVLESDGEIVWVPGYRLAGIAKVTAATQTVLHVRWEDRGN